LEVVMNDIEQIDRAYPPPTEDEIDGAQARFGPGYRDATRFTAPRTPRRFPFRTVVPVAAAAAVALVALALGAGDNSNSTALAQALDSLATAARAQPSIRAGSYAYRETRSDYGAEFSKLIGGKRVGNKREGGTLLTWNTHALAITQEWQSAAGDLLRCTRTGATLFDSQADRQAWQQAGAAPYQAPRFQYERFLAARPGLAGTRETALPATVTGIARVMSRLKYRTAGAQLDAVQGLLAWSRVRPATRAAIFRYLATVPGLTVVLNAKTYLGRPGIGIRVAGSGVPGSSHWVTRTAIFDAKTSNLIGYREDRTAKTPFSHGPTTSWEDYFRQGSIQVSRAKISPVGPNGFSLGKAAIRACAMLPRPR
jgi:hypothetical protein